MDHQKDTCLRPPIGLLFSHNIYRFQWIANIASMQQWGEAGEERLWAIAQAGTLPIQVLSHSNIADAAILAHLQIHIAIWTNTFCNLDKYI